jgi:hypothetical protein
MSTNNFEGVFGKIGDRLPENVFIARITEIRNRMVKIAALHANGQQSDPEATPQDVQEAIRLYDYLLKHPMNFNGKVVRNHLAALPITIAANPVLLDKEVAVHLEISYSFKDYSDVVPKEVADHFRIYPVQVFKANPLVKGDPWRDAVVTRVRNKEIPLPTDPKALKIGVYTKCVGITTVWGGSNIPCPYEDQVRILDQPRHRCEACTKEFTKIRTKMRRGGSAGVGVAKSVVQDLLDLL